MARAKLRAHWASLPLALLLLAAVGLGALWPQRAILLESWFGRFLAKPLFVARACGFSEPVGRPMDCGDLYVAADRSGSSDSIRLPVVVFRSTADDKRPDPLILINGGPGADALIDAANIANWRSWLAELPAVSGRDFIVADQRGAGAAAPSLHCPGLHRLPLDAEPAAARRAVLACKQALADRGIDSADYSTASMARDVIDLADALALESWNIWGESYGTRIALEIMRQRPPGLRSVIMDGVLPPDVDESVPAYVAILDRVLNRIFEACGRDQACRREYPNLRARFEALVAALREAPARLALYGDRPADAQDVELSDWLLLDLITYTLYSSESLTMIPDLISRSRVGDYALLGELAEARDWEARSAYISYGQNWAVLCSDYGHGYDDFAIAPADWLAPYRAWLEADEWVVCRDWQAEPEAQLNQAPVDSDIPTLLISGGLDPATPVEWARGAARRLANGFLFEFPSQSHDVGWLPCAQYLMKDFLDDPAKPPSNPCATRFGSIAFP